MAEASTVSVRICQEGHANALALNKECTQIAVAGRSLLKVLSIEKDGFTEVCNMRSGKNQNLSYSSNDVAWSTLDNNILATAATNGVVSVWDLSRFGRQKQLLVYNEHERTAHTVTFHSTETNLLISGSQDGTIKCFDIRMEKSINTYISNSESVRDVKFSPHGSNTFAAVSENGTVQLWDVRRPDRCTQQFTAHSGPIYTCDWHPNQQWLATGSRDKQIKIWNMSNKPTLEHTIHTIAVVGRVKWRPDKMYHIASCALVVDYSIHIWDVRRPYIPFASFNEHSNVTTGIGWKGNDSYVLLSTSKDSTVFKHAFKDAIRPAVKANPQSASLNSRGDLLFSYKIKVATPSANNLRTGIMNSRSKPSPVVDQFHISMSNLQSFTAKQAVPGAVPSQNKINTLKESIAFRGCAKEYILTGNLTELCDHNANVAKAYGKSNVSMLWGFVKHLYLFTSPQVVNTKSNSEPRNSNSSQTLLINRVVASGSQTSIGWEDKANGQKDDEWDLNGLNVITDEFKNPDFKHPKSGEFKHPGGPNSTIVGSHQPVDKEISFDGIIFDDTELTVNNINCVQSLRNGFLYTGPHELAKGWSLPNSSLMSHDIQEARTQEVTPEHTQESSPPPEPPSFLKITVQPVAPLWEPHDVLADCLTLQTDVGDVQTAVCILIALGDRRCSLPIHEFVHENWLLSYIELLQQQQLWNEATEIINLSWIRTVQQLNEQSTAVHTNCGECRRPLLNAVGWYCSKCKSAQSSKCSVCNLVVRGLYAWCQGCSHGGHLEHMRQWFASNSKCLKCGHLCEYE